MVLYEPVTEGQSPADDAGLRIRCLGSSRNSFSATSTASISLAQCHRPCGGGFIRRKNPGRIAGSWNKPSFHFDSKTGRTTDVFGLEVESNPSRDHSRSGHNSLLKTSAPIGLLYSLPTSSWRLSSSYRRSCKLYSILQPLP